VDRTPCRMKGSRWENGGSPRECGPSRAVGRWKERGLESASGVRTAGHT
jgi:hypothetical protein